MWSYLFLSLLSTFAHFLCTYRPWPSYLYILLVFTGRQSSSLSLSTPLPPAEEIMPPALFTPSVFCLAAYSLRAQPLLHGSWNHFRITAQRLAWNPLSEVVFTLNFVTGNRTRNTAETRTGPSEALSLPWFRRECNVDRAQDLAQAQKSPVVCPRKCQRLDLASSLGWMYVWVPNTPPPEV